MESLFSSYKQALKLKELGFDEPCLYQYVRDADNNGELIPIISETNYPIVRDNNQVFICSGGDCFAAPLNSQAFSWIRENYGLCHFINFSGKNYCSGWEDRDFNEFGYKIYNTYQEAESQCLTKLLKFVKKIQKESSKNIDIADSEDLDFNKLNSTDKNIIIDSKLTKKIDLTKDEFQYLSNDKKAEYINDFSKSGFHMQKWLWNQASDSQKSMYIQCRIDKQYKLQDYEFYYASESQKDTYIGNRIKNGYNWKESSQTI
jgi:hypothetical protein